MRAFACHDCGQLLFFENSHCLRCGTLLGFIPEQLDLQALSTRDGETCLAAVDLHTYRRCARAQLSGCNWLVPTTEPDRLCVACRLTAAIPKLRDDADLAAVIKTETAKRRLIYQLLDLGLPIVARAQDPRRGLAFELGFRTETEPFMTGHSDGVIRIDLTECDNAHRERLKEAFGEPYRTILGHFRHEIGHYYWDRLVEGTAQHERFREQFGDERSDYPTALARHYARGRACNWSDRYVSAYAASHPWEDWAETFAHYLHIRDTLQTAANFGLRVSPLARTVSPIGGKLSTRATEEIAQRDIDLVIAEWLPLVYAFNATNRSMGKEDLYPFVLAPTVIAKLGFVHDIVRGLSSAKAQRAAELRLVQSLRPTYSERIAAASPAA